MGKIRWGSGLILKVEPQKILLTFKMKCESKNLKGICKEPGQEWRCYGLLDRQDKFDMVQLF